MNWIVKNFLRGLIIVVPIAVSLYVVYRAFVAADALLPMRIPGLGIVIVFAGIVVMGAIASNFVIGKLLQVTELVFTRAPLVRIIYAAIRDLLEAFVGDKKRFDRPVAVSLTGSGDLMTLGFVTQDDLTFLSLPGHVAVYLPFSYSMAGSVIVVPAARVRPLPSDSASVMALIVSGGVSRATP
ncbi:MAG: DUF502 domain-containing protein [Thermoanaerobaculia bacterium]